MVKYFLVVLMALVVMLPGCGIFQSADGPGLEQKAELIEAAVVLGVDVGLDQVEKQLDYEDIEDFRNTVAEVRASIDENVLPVLRDPASEVTAAIENVALDELKKIIPDYITAVELGLKALHLYYEPASLEEVLSEEQRVLILAFVEGISRGAGNYLE